MIKLHTIQHGEEVVTVSPNTVCSWMSAVHRFSRVRLECHVRLASTWLSSRAHSHQRHSSQTAGGNDCQSNSLITAMHHQRALTLGITLHNLNKGLRCWKECICTVWAARKLRYHASRSGQMHFEAPTIANFILEPGFFLLAGLEDLKS